MTPELSLFKLIVILCTMAAVGVAASFPSSALGKAIERSENDVMAMGLIMTCIILFGLNPAPWGVECLVIATLAWLEWELMLWVRHAKNLPRSFLWLLWVTVAVVTAAIVVADPLHLFVPD